MNLATLPRPLSILIMRLAPAQPYARKSQTLAKPHIHRQERALERYCAHPDGCGHLVQRPMGYNTVASQPSVQVLKERNSQPRWFVVPLFVAHFSYRLPLPAGVLCCRALQSRLIKPLCPTRRLLIAPSVLRARATSVQPFQRR